jgi:hypothetical protein
MITLAPEILRALLISAAVGDVRQLQDLLTENGLNETDLLPQSLPPAPKAKSLGRFRYAGQTVDVALAGDLKGLLCCSVGGGFFLHVDQEDGSFRDHAWRHSDAVVTVPECSDICIYKMSDGTFVLDHAPATLGLNPI